MAITNSNPSFNEAEKDFFITDALMGLDTMNNRLLYPATRVKGDRYTFPVFSANPLLQPFGNGIPVDLSTSTLSDKNVNLGKFVIYEQFDPSVFENHWHRDQLTDLLMDRKITPTFENYLAGYYTQKGMTQVERMIHLGSVGYTTSASTTASVNYSIKYFDGIIRQALVGSALQVASPVVLTSANIISKMEAMKALLPKAILSSPNRYDRVKYCLSVEDFQLYEEALVSTSFKNQNTTDRGLNQYKGYKVIVLGGMPKDTMYLCEATTDPTSNLHLAINDYGDMSFKLDYVQNNSEIMFYKLQMKMGVGIAKFNEFVMYTTQVLGNFTA